MPAVTRRGDVCTGHGCWPPRPSTGGSPDVFANGIAVHRQRDTWAAHTCPAICAALPAICEKLLAHAVVDGPATTEQDAIDWRETIASQRLIPVDPAVKVFEDGVSVVQPLSPAIIGIGVRRDHEKQGRPFHSWANQPVQGIVGPSRPINFSLTDGAS